MNRKQKLRSAIILSILRLDQKLLMFRLDQNLFHTDQKHTLTHHLIHQTIHRHHQIQHVEEGGLKRKASEKRRRRKKYESDPSSSDDSDDLYSSDDSHFRRRRHVHTKNRKEDPIQLCVNLTAKLLTTAFKSKIIRFKLDEDPLQRRIYFLTFIDSLNMVFSQY